MGKETPSNIFSTSEKPAVSSTAARRGAHKHGQMQSPALPKGSGTLSWFRLVPSDLCPKDSIVFVNESRRIEGIILNVKP